MNDNKILKKTIDFTSEFLFFNRDIEKEDMILISNFFKLINIRVFNESTYKNYKEQINETFTSWSFKNDDFWMILLNRIILSFIHSKNVIKVIFGIINNNFSKIIEYLNELLLETNMLECKYLTKLRTIPPFEIFTWKKIVNLLNENKK
jgi:hypothetical protein